MKPHPPVLTPAAVAAAAAKKAARAKRKLDAAKGELRESKSVLVKRSPQPAAGELDEALRHNLAAEESLQEATEEIEAVEELLSSADGTSDEPNQPGQEETAHGKSGEGAKSTIPHLRR